MAYIRGRSTTVTWTIDVGWMTRFVIATSIGLGDEVVGRGFLFGWTGMVAARCGRIGVSSVG